MPKLTVQMLTGQVPGETGLINLGTAIRSRRVEQSSGPGMRLRACHLRKRGRIWRSGSRQNHKNENRNPGIELIQSGLRKSSVRRARFLAQSHNL